MDDEQKQVNADWDRSKSEPKPRRSPAAIVAAIAVLVNVGMAAWMITARESEPEVTTTTILNSFEDMADLVTQEYVFSGVGQFSDSGRKLFGWDVPLTGKSFLVTYQGSVTAGIDFSEIDVRLDDDVQRITVLAAEPTVLSSIIDPASVEQYDQSFNPINQISVDDVATFLSEATDSHRMEAINGGLLARAEAQAEALLTNQVGATIRGTDLEEYEIAFQWKRNQ